MHVVTYHYGSGEPAPTLSVHRIPDLKYRRLSPGPSYLKLGLLDPLLTLKLWRVLRRYPVDIIHAHHFEGLLVARAARPAARVPVVFDAHTLLMSELPSYPLGLPFRAKLFIAGALDRRLPAMADHVVTVTDRIRDRLLQRAALSADAVSVIRNGADTQHFAVIPKASAMATQGSPTLIFTGNLASYQRIDLMLRAFRRVLDRRSDVRLTIVTNSPFDPYQSLARELGITGAIDVVPAPFDEVPGLLARATVAINPRTDCDGIPVKLLNYMAAGKPVVSFAGAAPGIRHRETGWVVPDGDVEGFAEGALTLIAHEELADALGDNARRFVEAQHSWERSAEMLEAIFRRLSARRVGSQAAMP